MWGCADRLVWLCEKCYNIWKYKICNGRVIEVFRYNTCILYIYIHINIYTLKINCHGSKLWSRLSVQYRQVGMSLGFYFFFVLFFCSITYQHYLDIWAYKRSRLMEIKYFPSFLYISIQVCSCNTDKVLRIFVFVYRMYASGR